MKEEFSGFYGLDEEEVKKIYQDKETIFIFDTNILLNLYRCELKTRNTFISIWRSMEEKVWVPYHVILEYQRKRVQSIEDNINDLNNIPKDIELKITEAFDKIKTSKKSIISRYSALGNEIKKLEETINIAIESFRKDEIEKRIEFIDLINKKDEIRNELGCLLKNRIGKKPSQDCINKINTDGKNRFKLNIGPGFADEKEKSKLENYNFDGIEYTPMFGDLYIWEEILKYVKDNQLKNIIWISNDLKNDFIYITKSKKKRGAREDLRTEIQKKSGCDNFIAHSFESFLHHINKVSEIKINENSISELIQSGRVNISESCFISLDKPHEVLGILHNQHSGLLAVEKNLINRLNDYNQTCSNVRKNNDYDRMESLGYQGAEIHEQILDVSTLLLKVNSLINRFNESNEDYLFKKELIEFFSESQNYIITLPITRDATLE